jgi:hypothetical protein
MQNGRGPQQGAGEASANSEIAKIESGQQVVDEEGPSGLRSCIIATRLARQCEGEERKTCHPRYRCTGAG